MSHRERQLVELFEGAFTDSEGATEGRLIGGLVRQLLETTPSEDLRLFTLDNATGSAPVAAAIFTCLVYDKDARCVFLLSPMAVRTDHQRQGLGQELLSHALAALRQAGVDIVVTYGDPAFYGLIGFRPVETRVVPAPFELSQPEGWLALSLNEKAVSPLPRPVRCARALNHPDVW